jgi:hypothetical protein
VSVDEVAAEAVPLLTGALGRDYARLRWEGEQLSRDELAQRALEAIDEVLAPVHA